MKILLSGASGLIGRELAKFLGASGHRVTPLLRHNPAQDGLPWWDWEEQQIDLQDEGDWEAVIHLAGENIAQRWNASTKERLRNSRVQATQFLCAGLATMKRPPRVLLCASAVGYYGDRGSEIVREDSGPGEGFLAGLCQEWEAATQEASRAGIRVVQMRLGIVLAAKGGALAKMLPPFRWGLGGKLGSGRQYWSWVHIEDVVRAVQHLLKTDNMSGAVNLVSPYPVTNMEFTKTLGSVLKRPTFCAVPAFALNLLFGEMGRETMLASARAEPTRLLAAGFNFQHPELEPALKELLLDRPVFTFP